MSKYDLNRSIPQTLVKKYADVSRWKSVTLILGLYAVAIFCVWAQIQYLHWSAGVITLLFIGGIQHHLVTLMHEGAHYSLHPDRKVNDRFAQALCAFPLGMMLKDYRYFHLMHHKYSGDPEKDPEIRFYQGTSIGYGVGENKIITNLISDMTGVATIRSLAYMKKFNEARTKEGKLRSVKIWDLKWGMFGLVSILAVPALMGFLGKFLLFWLLSYLIVTPILIRWHSVGEHTGKNPEHEQDKTLTHNFNPLVNFFLYPINSGFHLEHHLFAQIPWYNMKAFRKEIMSFELYRCEASKLTVDGFWFGNKTVKDIVLKEEVKLPEALIQ